MQLWRSIVRFPSTPTSGHIEQLSDTIRRATAVANLDRSQDFISGRAVAVTLRFDQAQATLVLKSNDRSFLDRLTNNGVHNMPLSETDLTATNMR